MGIDDTIEDETCEDCRWLQCNITPTKGIYEKCANGHTYPCHPLSKW